MSVWAMQRCFPCGGVRSATDTAGEPCSSLALPSSVPPAPFQRTLATAFSLIGKRGLSITLVRRYAWNVELLICGRVFQSLGLSSAGVVGAGSLADVYPPAVRGNAMVRASATAHTHWATQAKHISNSPHRAGTRRWRSQEQWWDLRSAVRTQ